MQRLAVTVSVVVEGFTKRMLHLTVHWEEVWYNSLNTFKDE